MTTITIGSKKQWLEARRALLAKEKAHTKARDELAKLRQALPWVKVEKPYVFEGDDGPVSLADLFDGKSQLIVYHFMFDPEWEAGCKSCSFVADHYAPAIVHLAHRDTALATVSIAPLFRLQAFKKRMGWTFSWVSSSGNDFNRDFKVTFTKEELSGKANYNFQENVSFPEKEAPGISVFAKNEVGEVYHTYSSYGRGLEDFIGAYRLLDITPKGRDEYALNYGMEWVRLKDRYKE